MTEPDNNHTGQIVAWIISVIITFALGYSSGTGSKQPLLDQQQTQITQLTRQIKSLSSTSAAKSETVPTPEPTTVYTPAPAAAPAPTSDAQECAITTCNDGSCSSSTGRGTCSWHGGVAHYN